MNQNCRGSWALGTACGKCPRCEATRPAIAALRPQEAVMQSELKPCPFCGGEAELFHHTSAGLEPSWHVECSNVDGVYEGCGCGTCHHETAAEAITTWNARASDAEITRLTEALRAAEEQVKGLREALTRLQGLVSSYRLQIDRLHDRKALEDPQ